MRRVDVFGIGIGVLVAGGLVFVGLQTFGVDSAAAGIWTQAVLVVGLLGWVVTYALRAVTGSMTYHQQRQSYEDAFIQKRLDELTPEELAKLQAEVEEERQKAAPNAD